MRFFDFIRFSISLLILAGWGSLSSADGISGNYVIQPTDVIKMSIFQEPELEQEVRVAADGSVILPLIGRVVVGGMTVDDAQRQVTYLYDRDYLVQPHVSLLVLVYTEKRVEVLGMVNRPGKVPIPPEEELTLTEAISGAGGHTRLANLKKVRLTRMNAQGKPEVTTVDFLKISRGQANDIVLEDGDTVFISESFF